MFSTVDLSFTFRCWVLASVSMGEKTGKPGPDPRGETKRKRFNIVQDDLRLLGDEVIRLD